EYGANERASITDRLLVDHDLTVTLERIKCVLDPGNGYTFAAWALRRRHDHRVPNNTQDPVRASGKRLELHVNKRSEIRVSVHVSLEHLNQLSDNAYVLIAT